MGFRNQLILLSWIVVTTFIVNVQSTTEYANREHGLARLLGGQQEADHFIRSVWGKDQPYFLPSSTHNITKPLLWSLELMEYYLKKKDQEPWIYENDIKMVKSGKVHYQSTEPGTWEDVQNNFEEGVTIVMHGLQKRHQPIQQLSAALESELEIFVGANSYLTPGGSTGFNPHWDWHDILVIQLEGSKNWTVCEQRDVDLYRFQIGIIDGIYKQGEEFGSCTEYVFRPGDVFYAPLGTIHYATANAQYANERPYSMHLTFSLTRQQFTWGQFLHDLVESETKYYSSKLSSLVASNKKLQEQIPIPSLHSIARSIDNVDLPFRLLQDLRQHVQELVTQELDSAPQLQSFLLSQLDPAKSPFEETINLYRYKMVMGRIKEPRNCASSIDFAHIDALLFWRFSNQGIMLEQVDDRAIIVAGSSDDEQFDFPLRWRSGLRYASGAWWEQSRGRFFRIQDVMLAAHLNRSEAIEMLQQLVRACLLDWRRDENSLPNSQN